MGTRIGLLKIPVLNLVLCLVLYTCFALYCISAVLRDRCWFCCSVMTATVINEHYYYYYYYFLLVINTNLAPILHRFRDTAFNGPKIAIFDYPSSV